MLNPKERPEKPQRKPRDTPAKAPSLLAAALDYARQGIPVHPLRPRGKEPITPNGFYDASTDEATIRAWWKKTPQANIGSPTGAASGFDVLDFDPRNGGDADGVIPDRPALPATRSARSGSGGLHRFYQHHDGLKVRDTLYTGVDLKADGGYIVLAPSVHPLGGRYEWLNTDALAPLPEWVVADRLALSPQEAPNWREGYTGPALQGRQEDAEKWIGDALAKVASGQGRNDTGFWLSCQLLWNGIPDPEAAILDYAARCPEKPGDPYTAREAWRSLASAARYPRREPARSQKPLNFAARRGKRRQEQAPDMVASVTDGGGDNGPIGPADSDATPEDERPQICISGRHLRELTADTVDVLTQANTPPVVFQRAGRLVRMRVHEDGRPVLEDHSENTVRERAAKVADWLKLVKSKETWRDVPSGPPLDVIRNLMAAPAWPFPAVTSITQAPALRPDGSILSQSGYDAVTRLIYAPAAGLRMPTIPEHPSHDDRRAAREVLEDILADFPFDSDASRAHAFALMLTAITRPAIEGFTPMAVITAPEAGTGKGLLADLVAIIATGSTQQNTPAPDNEGEWRDSIFSALRDGPVFVMLDNLRGALSSTALESALTSEVVKQRVKGVSTDEAIPQRAVWVATGNNLQLAGDMPRRCYRIRLDAEQAHPERRKDFRHEHLRAYARLHRGELLAALLTLARAWFADGCPAYDIPKKGSFEEWARIVGSILAHADIAGFLTDEDAMYAEADPSRSQWAAFLLAWHAAYGDTPQAIATIARDIAGEGNAVKLDYQALRDAVPDALAGELASVGKFTRRLGYALRPQVSRRYETPDGDVIWLMRGGEDSRLRAILWQVHFKPGSRSSGSEAAESENHHSHPSGLNDSSLVDTLRVMASDDSLDRMEKNRDGESRIERDVINTRGASDNHSQSLASLANHTGGDFPIEHVVIEEAVREAPGDTPSGASGKGATE